MGIFGALTTAVSGLRAQSYALENISGNIANSQTPGFKRVETSFVDMVPELPYRREVAGSVAAFSRLTNTLKGDPNATGIPTNVAINGEGFFVVQERAGYASNRPIFGGVDLYTRRGDFQLDKDGYLVNGAGFYLRGSNINPITGQVSGSGNEIIRVPNEPIPAQKTNQIVYQANLPSRPATASADSAVAGSELLDPAPASVPRTPPAGLTDFLNETVSGGAVTVYNENGTPIDLQLRWGKTANADAAAVPPVSDTWNLYYLQDGRASATTVWRSIGTPVTFNGNGEMTSASSVALSGLTLDGVNMGNVTLDFGSNGLTQYSTTNGLVQASTIQQDGYPSGMLDSVSVTSDGRVSGSYTNGRIVTVAEIPVVQFNADNALKRLDSGVYERTLESGEPIVGLNGSSLIGGYIEGSNTDIAEEFSKMIVTQQAYSANTRVVSTSQQMMTEVINMIR